MQEKNKLKKIFEEKREKHLKTKHNSKCMGMKLMKLKKAAEKWYPAAVIENFLSGDSPYTSAQTSALPTLDKPPRSLLQRV